MLFCTDVRTLGVQVSSLIQILSSETRLGSINSQDMIQGSLYRLK